MTFIFLTLIFRIFYKELMFFLVGAGLVKSTNMPWINILLCNLTSNITTQSI